MAQNMSEVLKITNLMVLESYKSLMDNFTKDNSKMGLSTDKANLKLNNMNIKDLF